MVSTVEPTERSTLTLGNETATDPEEVIYILTRYLAGMCDGAHKLDGVGFSGAHASFGHAMAGLPWERWSPRQKWAMYNILQRYKNTQLAVLWRYMPEMVEPVDNRIVGIGENEFVRRSAYTQREYRNVEFTKDAGEYLWEFRGSRALVFSFNYDYQVVSAIKLLPIRRFDPNTKRWIVPLTSSENTEAAMAFAAEYGFIVDDFMYEEIVGSLESKIKSISLSHATQTDFDVEGLPDGMALYPFQRAGVEFLVGKKSGLCGDEMGLGKTPTALCVALATNAFPMLIITTASTKENWRRESMRWLPSKTVITTDARSSIMDSNLNPLADIVIINYEQAKKLKPQLMYLSWGIIVCDEAHKLKNSDSQRYKNVKEIMDHHSDSRKLLLTGTPVVNEPMELWSLIDILGYGEKFGGKKAYKSRYDTRWTARLEELNARIRETFFIRRTKVQVLPDLPEKRREIVPVEIDNRTFYESVESDLATYMATNYATKQEFDLAAAYESAKSLGIENFDEISDFIRERQDEHNKMAFAEKFDIYAQNERLLRWGQLKQLATKGKMSAVRSWIEDFLEDSDQKIVVFCWHIECGKQIAEWFNARFISGEMKVDQRQIAVDEFESNPNRRVLVANMQTGGEGLNIQGAASNVAFVEYGWNPKDHKQAEDRLHRIGQKNSVMAWYLAASNTIDEEIASLIADKLKVVTAIEEGAGEMSQLEMIGALYDRMRSRRQL